MFFLTKQIETMKIREVVRVAVIEVSIVLLGWAKKCIALGRSMPTAFL